MLTLYEYLIFSDTAEIIILEMSHPKMVLPVNRP